MQVGMNPGSCRALVMLGEFVGLLPIAFGIPPQPREGKTHPLPQSGWYQRLMRARGIITIGEILAFDRWIAMRAPRFLYMDEDESCEAADGRNPDRQISQLAPASLVHSTTQNRSRAVLSPLFAEVTAARVRQTALAHPAVPRDRDQRQSTGIERARYHCYPSVRLPERLRSAGSPQIPENRRIPHLAPKSSPEKSWHWDRFRRGLRLPHLDPFWLRSVRDRRSLPRSSTVDRKQGCR